MEELRENSLSGPSQMDPAALAALYEAQQLEGRDVYDVNGDRLGKVTRCFAEDQTLVRCDITLTNTARDLFEADRDVAQVPPAWIASVDDEGIRLRKSGDDLLHPEKAGASFNDGAKGFPRKVR
jgi:hypothetical protein